METQPSLLDWTPTRVGSDFGGITFDKRRDGKRLDTQLQRVHELMSDGAWWTLPELKEHLPTASEHLKNGLWAYRMVR
jgi:hypothetical protein